MSQTPTTGQTVHGVFDPGIASRLHLLAGLPSWVPDPPEPQNLDDPVVAETRKRVEAFNEPVAGYRVPQVHMRQERAPGPHGGIDLRVYTSVSSEPVPGHALVWVHGGGFVSGDLDMPETDVVARELVARGLAAVVSVGYRLAGPGTTFPIPHDDVHAAFQWAVSGSTIAGPGHTWSLGGASAGANLALGVSARLRDNGEAGPAALVLCYPVVHYELPPAAADLARTMNAVPDALRFSPASVRRMNDLYLGDAPADAPFAMPGDGSLHGLPRTLVLAAEFDDLRSSGQLLASDMTKAGVACDYRVVAGVPHGVLNLSGVPASLQSLSDIVRFVSTIPSGV